LHARHFPGAKRKTARNRLGQLSAAGYLRRVDSEALHPAGGATRQQSAYVLGPRAPAALRLRSLTAPRPRHAPSHVAHQLAVNQVADWLGARLLPEHDTSAASRHRADGAYIAAPDAQGRTLVLLEVDLGHYTRKRVLGKLAAFLAHPDASAIVLATPTWERAAQIGRWAREAHGEEVMRRVHPLTFEQVRRGLLPPELAPSAT
jgi:Replication-relaxation